MLLHDSLHGLSVDLAQIVVHENVAEPADLLPGNARLGLFERVGQALGRLGQGLQIAQDGVVEHFVLRQVATLLDTPDFLDGIENMPSVDLPRLAHSSMASFSTASRR